MALDPYSPCPCASGKKLKFCCNDLAGDIEKIQRMVAGDQPHAALKHVSAILEKQPDRASLLDIRANLELSLHEFDAARQTINRNLVAHPKNPAALGQRAILLAATESGTAAIGPLQDALELLDNDMPLRVLEAIGGVGHALLLEGDFVAGRGHLLLYAGIAPEGDRHALELLLRLNLQGGLPLILREHLALQPAPTDSPWKGEFDQATRASSRGQWRTAEGIFDSVLEKGGPLPELVYNLALVRGWLGRMEQFAEGLHEYSRLDVSQHQAVEAEALAQLVDPRLADPTLDSVRISIAVTDEDGLSERFAFDERIENYPIDPEEFDEDLGRPRSTHILLSKPTPSASPELTRDDVPLVLGFLSLYGKRTDREAQLDLTCDRTDDFERTKSLLVEIGGEALGTILSEEVVGEKSLSENALSWRWRLPVGTPREQRNRLVAQQRRSAIFEAWTNAPRAALAGMSPRQASAEPSLRIALLASILIIEQAAVEPDEIPMFNELRVELGVPAIAPLDPATQDLSAISLVWIPYLELSKLSDRELSKLLNRSLMTGANLAILVLAGELVALDRQHTDVDLTNAFQQLIRLDPNIERSRNWLLQAREWSEANHRSVAQWALLELQLAIESMDSTTAQRVLNEIRSQHINEPGVAEATYRLLQAAGLLAPSATQPMPLAMPKGKADGVSATSGSGGRFWTPDDDSAEAVPSSGKSTIWTP